MDDYLLLKIDGVGHGDGSLMSALMARRSYDDKDSDNAGAMQSKRSGTVCRSGLFRIIVRGERECRGSFVWLRLRLSLS